jgi:hypothetical protein
MVSRAVMERFNQARLPSNWACNNSDTDLRERHHPLRRKFNLYIGVSAEALHVPRSLGSILLPQFVVPGAGPPLAVEASPGDLPGTRIVLAPLATPIVLGLVELPRLRTRARFFASCQAKFSRQGESGEPLQHPSATSTIRCCS